ncbi:MAG TPA: DUF1697 domain-containing protein [Thermoanaerobaculia bacterium]|nr:DUF1697 domain-containing protein [Thermoanaerobaculia bacterium]
MRPATFIALLRGVNVSGHNRVPMSDLRLACAGLGWTAVQTYIQSGNVLFRAAASAASLEEELERLIERELGLSIPVIVRTAKAWSSCIRGNPFPEASQTEPNLVMLALSKATPKQDAAEQLQARAVGDERIARVGDALWIHFSRGVGRTRLSPALLDRLAGSPVTMRNWRTALKLEELAQSMV